MLRLEEFVHESEVWLTRFLLGCLMSDNPIKEYIMWSRFGGKSDMFSIEHVI